MGLRVGDVAITFEVEVVALFRDGDDVRLVLHLAVVRANQPVVVEMVNRRHLLFRTDEQPLNDGTSPRRHLKLPLGRIQLAILNYPLALEALQIFECLGRRSGPCHD